MDLSGPQRRQLRDALISAFPNYLSLKQMLAFQLNKRLNEIVQDTNLQTVVFNLIENAEAEGWLDDLVQAAREYNPGNLQLRAIAEELLPNHASETHNEVPQENLYRQNSISCVDKLGQFSNAELRRLMARRLNLSEVRNIWFDTLDNQMDNFKSQCSVEDCVVDLLQRAEQHGLKSKLIENLCTERPDIANP